MIAYVRWDGIQLIALAAAFVTGTWAGWKARSITR